MRYGSSMNMACVHIHLSIVNTLLAIATTNDQRDDG